MGGLVLLSVSGSGETVLWTGLRNRKMRDCGVVGRVS